MGVESNVSKSDVWDALLVSVTESEDPKKLLFGPLALAGEKIAIEAFNTPMLVCDRISMAIWCSQQVVKLGMISTELKNMSKGRNDSVDDCINKAWLVIHYSFTLLEKFRPMSRLTWEATLLEIVQ